MRRCGGRSAARRAAEGGAGTAGARSAGADGQGEIENGDGGAVPARHRPDRWTVVDQVGGLLWADQEGSRGRN